MATQQAASIQITNNTGGNATIILFHKNSTNGKQSARFEASSGATVGLLEVFFKTGLGSFTVQDWWSVMVQVQDGPSAGMYYNEGSSGGWKECQLQSADAGQTLTFTLSTTSFDINLPSGACSDTVVKRAPYAPVSHVFVVMLENRSFDNMFAGSEVAKKLGSQITVASPSNSNSYNGQTYNVSSPMVDPMTSGNSLTADPGHEFLDVFEQLCGQQATWPEGGGPYPPVNTTIDMSGFVANYATSTTEQTKPPTAPPAQSHWKDVMACGDTNTGPGGQPDGFMWLASHGVICDHWFSSMPGPTWPNRFFVHGASSAGFDDSPTTSQIKRFEVGPGLKYPNGSIFDALGQHGIPYRIYHDTTGPTLAFSLYNQNPSQGSRWGAIPQVTSIYGVPLMEVQSLKQFADDLQGPYPYPYTFIEPHYGQIVDNTYVGGSSQHPMDGLWGGDQLLTAVYQGIAQSKYFPSSLLIVIYDEHGGLYDSVPPPAAVPPGDNYPPANNTHGFRFDRYGPRVPGVIVSPLLKNPGTVDHTIYDHSSVLATLEKLWNIPPLTARDAAAETLLHLLTSSPGVDVPQPPPPLPAPITASPAPGAGDASSLLSQPIPERGNLVGALHNALKTHLELAGKAPADIAAVRARFDAVRTRGDADDYVKEVFEKLATARSQHEAAAPADAGNP